jgi:hypothetical protein
MAFIRRVWCIALLALGCTANSRSCNSETQTWNGRNGCVEFADLEGGIILPDQDGQRLLIMSGEVGADWTKPESFLWELKKTDLDTRTEGYIGKKWSDAKVEKLNGKYHMLFCGSSNFIVLLDMHTRDVVFSAKSSASTHDCVMLPDGNIVAVGTGGKSDAPYKSELQLFDVATGQKIQTQTQGFNKRLGYIHGAVWDDVGKQLVVVAPKSLGAFFKYEDKKLVATARQPSNLGCNHDAMPGPDKDTIICTGGFTVYIYNIRTKREIKRHRLSSGLKGADINRKTNEIIVAKNEKYFRARGVDTVPGLARRANGAFLFYKAHWFQPNVMMPAATRSFNNNNNNNNNDDDDDDDDVDKNNNDNNCPSKRQGACSYVPVRCGCEKYGCFLAPNGARCRKVSARFESSEDDVSLNQAGSLSAGSVVSSLLVSAVAMMSWKFM